LLEALERLKQKLAAEGLFALERKRQLPDPVIIGVVTSRSGAAFHDICKVLFRRGAARVVLASALVQGEDAPRSLLKALNDIERFPGLSLVILGRGGGSEEDLMAFNDEQLVRRVASLRVPVVSAVGHEVDVTLTDLAADVRAATPSHAAELVMPERAERIAQVTRNRADLLRVLRAQLASRGAALHRLRSQLGNPRWWVAEGQQVLDDYRSRLEGALRRSWARARSRLSTLEPRLQRSHPAALLARHRRQLDPLAGRFSATFRLALENRWSRLYQLQAALDALSPLSVLARGYAIARTADGRVVRAATSLRAGETLELLLHLGRAEVVVSATFNQLVNEVASSKQRL
jgi:exodeoxyribonuclease VII large subunit